MIAVDTNILLYAHREELAHHRDALAALTLLAEGSEPWGVPVFCLGEFLRVITHRRVFDPPHTLEEATTSLEALLASPTASVLSPRVGYAELFVAACLEGGATGNMVFDAQLVALCRQHRAELLTADRDFARFRGFPTRALPLGSP